MYNKFQEKEIGVSYKSILMYVLKICNNDIFCKVFLCLTDKYCNDAIKILKMYKNLSLI